jgi:hypothetical protein
MEVLLIDAHSVYLATCCATPRPRESTIDVLDAFAKGYWRIAGATSSTRGKPRR